MGGAEDGDLGVGFAEGFDTFVGLLACGAEGLAWSGAKEVLESVMGFTVVKGWCHAMNAQERVFNELWRSPLASLDAVVGFDMTIDCHPLL